MSVQIPIPARSQSGTGFGLALRGSPQNFNGVTAEDSDYIAQQYDSPGHQKKCNSNIDCTHGNPHFQINWQMGDVEQEKIHQLTEYSAGKDPADQASDA